MVEEPTMLDILTYCSRSANDLSVFTREEFRKYVKQRFGEKFLAKLNEAFKLGYIKRLRIHGYDLSDKGFKKLMELEEVK